MAGEREFERAAKAHAVMAMAKGLPQVSSRR